MPGQSHYSTARLSPAEKGRRWREFISNTFVELDLDRLPAGDFYGELTARQVGGIGIASVTTDGYDVYRTQDGIDASPADDVLLSLQTAGTCVVRQLGAEAVLRPGDFALYDSALPYQLHFEQRLSQIVLQIPRERLGRHFASPEALMGVRIPAESGITALTTGFIREAFRQGQALDGGNAVLVSETLLELFTAAIRGSSGMSERRPGGHAKLIMRIKAAIERDLQDPELSPASIARRHGISLRYLQKLFEKEGVTPGRYVTELRLAKAREDLRSGAMRHRSVSEIAYRWGFNDASHFSRTFKARYDRSPREYRVEAGGSD